MRQRAPYDHNACPPSQTDGRTDIMAIARRFVRWTHRVPKITGKLFASCYLHTDRQTKAVNWY